MFKKLMKLHKRGLLHNSKTIGSIQFNLVPLEQQLSRLKRNFDCFLKKSSIDNFLGCF